MHSTHFLRVGTDFTSDLTPCIHVTPVCVAADCYAVLVTIPYYSSEENRCLLKFNIFIAISQGMLTIRKKLAEQAAVKSEKEKEGSGGLRRRQSIRSQLLTSGNQAWVFGLPW